MKKPSVQTALAVVAPLGFGIAPLLSICKANPGEIPLIDLPRPLAASALVSVALFGLATLLCRKDRGRGSVAASLILVLGWNFIGFSSFVETPLTLIADQTPLAVHRFVPAGTYALWLLATGLILLMAARARFVPALLKILAPMSVALVFLAVPWRSALRSPELPKPPVPVATPDATTSPLPDIYVIVLDAYGRHDVLKTLYGFDDSPFVDGLRQRGFQVPTKSRANYLQTALAVGALFRLDYWRTPPQEGDGLDAVIGAQQNVANAPLMKILRERGYHRVAISTGGPVTPSFADTLLYDNTAPPGYFRELENVALDRGPLAPIPRGQDKDYARHRQSLRGAFRALGEPPPGPAPHFVFCHILAPHPPFVFGSKGEERTPSKPFHIGDATDYSQSGEGYREGYAGQAEFVGKSILEALDRLRAASKRPAALLIVGDHGPRRFTDWGDLSQTYAPEGFGNLVAIALPEGKPVPIPDETTPLNALRFLLNGALDTRLAPLPDRSFYSTLKAGFTFTDVTDAARKPVNLADAKRVHPTVQSR